MKKKDLLIENKLGLQRPGSRPDREGRERFNSKILLSKDGIEVDGKRHHGHHG